MIPNKLAKELGHTGVVIAHYEELRQAMMPYDNSNISELDMIYFLPNILWGTNFELVARILREYGYADRLRQWQEAYADLTKKPRVVAIWQDVNSDKPDVCWYSYKIMLSDDTHCSADMSDEAAQAFADSLGIKIQQMEPA